MDYIKDMAECLLNAKIGDDVILAEDYIRLCICFEGLVLAFENTDCNPYTILALRDAIYRQYMANGICDIPTQLWDHICGEFNLNLFEL